MSKIKLLAGLAILFIIVIVTYGGNKASSQTGTSTSISDAISNLVANINSLCQSLGQQCFYTNTYTTTTATSNAVCGDPKACSFGPFTPNTKTSGIQEAINSVPAGGTVQVKAGTYSITSPITLSSLTLSCDIGTTITVTSQIDGGIVQVITSGLSSVAVKGCILDGNNLSMQGIWIAKATLFTLANLEIKNIMGIAGLQTAQNPTGILANGQGGGTISNVIVHDISAPTYSGGNGDCFWLTGTIGINKLEKVTISNSQCYNTMNVAANELIGGIKFDVNTMGFTANSVSISNLSGDGVEVLAGGPNNISTNHTISGLTISNVRIGINLNANNGGSVKFISITQNTIMQTRYYYVDYQGTHYGSIYENSGSDYITYVGNNVPQGRIVAPPAGAHDILQGNIGF